MKCSVLSLLDIQTDFLWLWPTWICTGHYPCEEFTVGQKNVCMYWYCAHKSLSLWQQPLGKIDQQSLSPANITPELRQSAGADSSPQATLYPNEHEQNRRVPTRYDDQFVPQAAAQNTVSIHKQAHHFKLWNINVPVELKVCTFIKDLCLANNLKHHQRQRWN